MRNDTVVLEKIKTCVKERLEHCSSHLRNNKNKIAHSNYYGYVFQDGTHYSIPAARAMEKILASNKISNFNGSMLMQAIKACGKHIELLDILCEQLAVYYDTRSYIEQKKIDFQSLWEEHKDLDKIRKIMFK